MPATMRALALLALLIALGAVAAEQAENAETADVGGVKNETAGGRGYDDYERRGGYEHERGSYARGGYERPHYSPLLDQFVCDLDATILVVASTNKEYKKEGEYKKEDEYKKDDTPEHYASREGGGEHKYGPQPPHGRAGYERHSYAAPNAIRLKCAHIATRSEEDCQQCCKLSARRDQSVSRKDIFGFIINGDEVYTGATEAYRAKRNADGNGHEMTSHNYQSNPSSGYGATSPGYPAPTPGYAAAPSVATRSAGSGKDYAYASPPSYDYRGPPRNRQCVCCAPRHHEPARKYEGGERRYGRGGRDYEHAANY